MNYQLALILHASIQVWFPPPQSASRNRFPII